MKLHFPILILFFLILNHDVYSQKVGLVLSGGGARGLAHIGVIRALEEQNIPIDFVCGSSMGALIAGMYAQGYSPDEMEELVSSPEFYNWALGIIPAKDDYYFKRKEDNASWITLRFHRDSIFQTSLPTSLINSMPMDFSMMEHSAPSIAKAHYNFDSLMVPFRCIAADIEDKKQIVFRNGDLGEAIRASSAFPFYFKPVNYNGKILFDGGLYNNFPADVLENEFHPDFIIGVDAVDGGAADVPPDEDDIISQVKAMFMSKTDYHIRSKNAILLHPKTGNIGLLDFENVHKEIQTGYTEAMMLMDSMQKVIVRRIDTATMHQKRRDFVKDMPKLIVNEVIVEGVNRNQGVYIRKILMPSGNPIPIADLRSNYYKLIADDNIKSIYPKLVYHQETGYYVLMLKVKQERDLKAMFGGDFASLPISEGYIGVQYNMWAKQALSLNTNVYFGKLYSSAQMKARLDVPSKVPFYLEGNFTINTWDYFKSSSSFFEDVKPPYLVTTDRKFAFDAGLPLGNEQKVYGGISYISTSDNYYQTTNFLLTDTADVTNFSGYSPEFVFVHNTLNKKQYASAGSLVNFTTRYVNGREHTIPGSTSNDTTQIFKNHHWIQANITLDKYYKQRGVLRFGVYAEVNASTQDFFSNYTSTALAAPAFNPIAESKTLFLGQYRAHNYGAFGLKNIISTKFKIDIRFEGYIFQPYRSIYQQADLTAANTLILAKRLYMATAAAVYNTPVGPVSLSFNYYDQKVNPYSILFHFGYIIFNKKALD